MNRRDFIKALGGIAAGLVASKLPIPESPVVFSPPQPIRWEHCSLSPAAFAKDKLTNYRIADVTAFGDTWRQYIQEFPEATLEIKGRFE